MLDETKERNKNECRNYNYDTDDDAPSAWETFPSASFSSPIDEEDEAREIKQGEEMWENYLLMRPDFEDGDL